MNKNNFIEVRTRIERSWSIETSYKPDEWTKDNAAWGQCAVTTKLVKQLLGGICMQALFTINKAERKHYWNNISGVDVDITWRQMLPGTRLFSIERCPESHLITDNWMQERFNILKENYYLQLLRKINL